MDPENVIEQFGDAVHSSRRCGRDLVDDPKRAFDMRITQRDDQPGQALQSTIDVLKDRIAGFEA